MSISVAPVTACSQPRPTSGRQRSVPLSLVDRKARRVAVAIPSRVRYRGMLSADVVIRDLAFTGFRAECVVELAKGDRISIDLPPFGLVPARIAWCREEMIGGLFDSVVDIRHCVMKPDVASYFSVRRRRTVGRG